MNEQEKFIRYLEEVKELTKDWPEWKKNILRNRDKENTSKIPINRLYK